MTNILRVAAAGNRIVSPQAGCNGNTVLISRRSASPPQRRQVCQTENSQSENGPGPDAVELVPETCTPREHVWGPPSQKVLVHLHATVHAPRRDVKLEKDSRTLWPSRARGDLSLLKAASYVDTLRYGGRDTVAARTLAHALTQRTRETPCRWRRGGMCTARSPSARAPNC